MMLHEKLMSGQFLLGLKNDRSGLIPATAATHHQAHNLQSPSPPMPALDIYSAYAYQHQLQQQLLMSSANPIQQQTNVAEVLDLSRRELVDLAYKTPSPNQTSSSVCSRSPADSPTNKTVVPTSQQPPHLPSKLLYAAQAYQQAHNVNNLPITSNLAALYPHPYYAGGVKQELTPPATTVPLAPLTPITTNNNSLLKSFASAAVAAATSLKNDISEPISPQPAAAERATATSPTSTSSHLGAHDPKNTRPFKAFPRDPLVIAANFAATDVLLDNPRVERYTEYRKRVLEQIRSSNGGFRTVTNPKMRRTNLHSGSVNEGSSGNNSENDERHREESSDCDSNSGQDQQVFSANSKSNENSNANETNNQSNNTSCSGGIVKDAAYYERRRKNNAAAKKSRDRRRIKEDEIAIRAAYLERQNIELLCQIDTLKAQIAALTAKLT